MKVSGIKDPIYNLHGAFTWVVMTRNFNAWEVVKNTLVTNKLFIEGNNRALFGDKKLRKYEGKESRGYKTIKLCKSFGFYSMICQWLFDTYRLSSFMLDVSTVISHLMHRLIYDINLSPMYLEELQVV